MHRPAFQRSLNSRKVWLVLPLIAVILAGCSTVGSVLGNRKPEARVVGVGFQDIGLDALTLLFDVEVSNPYSSALPLANIDYALSSRGATFLTGLSEIQGTIPASSSKVFKMPARIPYEELLSALQGVRPGAVVPYDAELGLSVDAPVLGALRLPMRKSGNVPVPVVPDVKVTAVEWDQLSLDGAAGHVDLNIINRNQFPIAFSNFDYAFTLGGVEVARSAIEKSADLQPDGGQANVRIPLSFTPRDAGLGLFRMLTSKSGNYGLSGDLQVATPFGPMSFPLKGAGETVFRN